jgi:osmotically-inducible protein OsmY
MTLAGAAAPSTGDPRAEELLTQLDRTLEAAGLYLATEIRDGWLMLAGEVDSSENRDAALDLAAAVATALGLAIDDNIEVVPVSPEPAFADVTEADRGAFGYLDPDRDDDTIVDPGFESDADFTDEPLTTDAAEAAAEAAPYFPPTDPVVAPIAGTQALEVVGGFEATSMDPEATAEAVAGERGDEELVEDVQRELREDALTTDLRIFVRARRGVVVLRGVVATLEDADNAAAVAERVAGVREVREELTIATLPRRPSP